MNEESRSEKLTASTVSWKPVQREGYNYRSHQIQMVSDDRIEFRATPTTKIISGALFTIGVAPLIFFLLPAVRSGDVAFSNPNIGMPILLFIFFAGIGGLIYRAGTRLLIFDKTSGYFWKGKKLQRQTSRKRGKNHCACLNTIAALQLLNKKVSGDEGESFSCNELNIVLKNSDRIHLLSHSNLRSIRSDTDRLAIFLGVPIWVNEK